MGNIREPEIPRRREPKWLILALSLFSVAAIAGLAWPELSTWVLFLAAILAPVAAVVLSRVLRARANLQALSREELRQRAITSQEQFDVLASGLESGIIESAPDGTIVFTNQRAERLVGEVGLIGSALQSPLLECLQQSLANEETAVMNEVFLGPQKDRMVLVRSWAVGDGDSVRVFLSLQDVTELRHLETVRRDFVANVSHELRTPMTTIRAMSETLLEDETNDAELKDRYLGRVISEIDRLTRITEDLLVLSVAESQTKPHSVFDLSELVQSVMRQLQGKAEQKSLLLVEELDSGCFVAGNESQLVQVVVNLIDNAINYTSEGEVRVTLMPTDKECILTVADSGIGIPAEHLGRIFERFYRVDKGRSRSTGGTGLGLSIVRNIVESHRGRVSVSSVMGEGSTFAVTLPRVEEPLDLNVP
ncbi:MAG: GHKL domain-containing protein [Fimbriimonadaceae bacterium]|nr:GHKL domain-containing protein [Fimbriimonadaceae bacterium]